MILNLNKEQLISLVKGAESKSGSYQLAEYLNKKNIGILNGFPNESWKWYNNELNKLNENQLYDLYLEIINWKDKPLPPPPKLSKERVDELQRSYFEMTGIWLPVDKKYIEQ